MFELNNLTEYKQYLEDQPIQGLDKMKSEGMIPLSFAGIMQRRLEVWNASADLFNSWNKQMYLTGDAIAYNPDGGVKIVLDYEPDHQAKRIDGAIIINKEKYDALEGLELTLEEVRKYATITALSKEKVMKNIFWRTLARGDELLKAYVDALNPIADEYKDGNIMRVYIEIQGFLQHEELTEKYYVRPWLIGDIKECRAFGLNDYETRMPLIGIPKSYEIHTPRKPDMSKKKLIEDANTKLTEVITMMHNNL